MKKKTTTGAPLTFDAKDSLLKKVADHVAAGETQSQVIRRALSSFNLDSYNPVLEDHRQISVRLDSKLRASLVKIAKKKKVSVGEIVRAAVDALPPAKKAKKG